MRKVKWIYLLLLVCQCAIAQYDCRELFTNALQTHGDAVGGQLYLGCNSVVESNNQNFATTNLVAQSGDCLLSCRGNACKGLNAPAKSLPNVVFVNNYLDNNFNSSLSDKIGFDGNYNFKNVVVLENSKVQFSNSSKSYHVQNLVAEDDSTVSFGDGDFYFENIKLGKNVTFRVRGNLTNIYVNHDVTLPSGFSISDNGKIKTFMYVHGNLTIDKPNALKGYFYAANDAVVTSQSTVQGAILAKSIDLQSSSKVVYLNDNKFLSRMYRVCKNNQAKYIKLTHATSGVLGVKQAVVLEIKDSANENIVDFDDTIVVDTGSRSGTWSLVEGKGKLVQKQFGTCEYKFSQADKGRVKLALTYRKKNHELDIEAYGRENPLLRDDDSTGSLTFKDNGFFVTDKPITDLARFVNEEQFAKITSGKQTSLFLTRVYFKANKAQIDTKLNKYKAYSVWQEYVAPQGGKKRIQLDNALIGTKELSENLLFNFKNGVARTTLKYKDVGKVRIGFSDVVNNTQHLDFLVLPHNLEVTVNRNPQAQDASGGRFLKAGEPFRVYVTARDFEGNITPSFGVDEKFVMPSLSSKLVAPANGSNNLNLTKATAKMLNPGVIEYKNVIFDEVGIINLSANISNNSFYGANVAGKPSANIGRFIPAGFITKASQVQVVPGCKSCGFTYIGQGFTFAKDVAVTLSPISKLGTKLKNYVGDFARIDKDNVVVNYTNSGSGILEANKSNVALVKNAGKIVINIPKPKLNYLRTSQLTSPFPARIHAEIKVSDKDGIVANKIDVNNNSGVLAFQGSDEVVLGRLVVKSSVGTTYLPLAAPIELQYFDGKRFAANEKDECTSFPQAEDVDVDNSESSLQISLNELVAGRKLLTVTRMNGSKFNETFNLEVLVNENKQYSYLKDLWNVEINKNPISTLSYK